MADDFCVRSTLVTIPAHVSSKLILSLTTQFSTLNQRTTFLALFVHKVVPFQWIV